MPKNKWNIYKRKDGRWEGRYRKGQRHDGRIQYGYRYGKSYLEVSEQLVAIGENDRFFAQVAYQWLALMSLKLKPSTCACYAASLETHILPMLGARRMKQMSGEDISSYAREKLETGRKDCQGGLSAKTVRDLLSIIKSIRDYAYKERLIESKFAVVYPRLPQNEMRVLTKQEQALLVAVLMENINIFKLGILLCLYTGLRVGEVCALRWQDLAGDFGMLTVRQTMQRIKSIGEKRTEIMIGEPKSLKSERTIPIPKFLTLLLREFAEKGSEYLLSTAGATFTEPRTMQNHFARNIREAGIADANYHSLRHTFATRCIEAGVDAKSLSEILGHANVNITLSRYVHSSLEQKRSCMERLEQYTGML